MSKSSRLIVNPGVQIHGAHPQITWYGFGERLSGGIPSEFDEDMLKTLRVNFSNLAPTTYKAAKEYLDEELRKSGGARDLPLDMCMTIVLSSPENQKVRCSRLLITLPTGSSISHNP
jgi:hypothetical protein